MTKYSTYKDSGVEWIGVIPEHWRISKLMYLTTLVTDGSHFSPSIEDVGKFYVTVSNVTKDNIIDFNNCLKISENSFNDLVKNGCQPKPNDILLTKDGTIGRGVVVTEFNDFVILSSLGLIRLKEDYYSHFILYYLLSELNVSQMYSHVRGSGITRLTINLINNLLIIIPPLSEQQAIVTYLDKKTTLIDNLIKKKQEKIQLLKENRTALINHVVTKGLDPEVEMKDSDIEWIGEVPVHWAMKKTTYVFKQIGSGTTPPSNDESFYDGHINWLQTGDLTDGIISKTSKKVTQKAIDQFSTLKIYPKGSLVIAMYGATIGKVGFLDIDTCTNQACCVLSSPNLVLVDFVYYWFLSAKQSIILMGYGGGQPNISQDTIRSLRLPVPSITEQQQIVTYLNEQTQLIDQTIQQEEQKIDLLKEYRQSMISEVVTGKICVLGN